MKFQFNSDFTYLYVQDGNQIQAIPTSQLSEEDKAYAYNQINKF